VTANPAEGEEKGTTQFSGKRRKLFAKEKFRVGKIPPTSIEKKKEEEKETRRKGKREKDASAKTILLIGASRSASESRERGKLRSIVAKGGPLGKQEGRRGYSLRRTEKGVVYNLR